MSDNPFRQLFNLEKASVLVADGDEMGLSILLQILSGFGAKHIVRAETAEIAKAKLSATFFDLMLIDPATLGNDAYEMTEWIRRSLPAPGRFMPVILVTGHTQSGRVSAARDGGANFFVSKPVSPATVYDRITWIAREKRPFVSCSAYAGPDRRWKHDGPPGEKGRRNGDKTYNDLLSAPERELTQQEVNAIMQQGRVAS